MTVSDPPIDKVPPLVIVKTPDLLTPLPEPKTTFPVTVKKELLLKFMVAVVLFPPVLFKVKEEQAALVTSTVTVILGLITTALALVGTGLPPQVAVLLQFPLTVAVRVCE